MARHRPYLTGKYLLEAAVLERRLLFSATPLPAEHVEPQQSEELVSPAGEMIPPPFDDAIHREDSFDPEGTQSTRLEIVFIDNQIDDTQQLMEDIRQGSRDAELEIYLLDSDRDGIEQINDILQGHRNVDAIHLLSHGNDAQLRIGNSVLNSSNLSGYASDLAGWNSSLNAQADILVYGCRFAGSAEGRLLAESIAELTGADVAASDDDTGSESLGGDWDLEFQVGEIESRPTQLLSADALWQGILPTPALVSTDEILVNTTTSGSQTLYDGHQAVAVDGAGNSVVTWIDGGTNVMAQRFDATGQKIGTEFQVNVTTAGNQINPAVTMDSSGRFAIAYLSPDADGDGIYIRRFDANGNAIDASDVQVNTTAEVGDQSRVRLASNDSNQIVISWESDGGDEGLYTRNFDFTSPTVGNAVTTTLIKVDTEASATDASIDINASGRYVIAWQDNSESWAISFDYGISTPVAAKLDVSFGTDEDRDFAVAVMSNNDYILTWRSDASFGNAGVWHSHISAAGVISGYDKVHNSTSAKDPSISIADDDTFIINFTAPDANGLGHFYRVYDSYATPATASIQVNQSTTGEQSNSSIAVHDQDNFVIVWAGNGNQSGNVDSNGVFFRQYGTNTIPIADPSAGAPYTISEGGTLSLDGSASSDADGDTLSFAWDLDNDGIFGEAGELTSETGTVSWATLVGFGIDDDGTYTINLRVDDGNGAVSTQTTTVTVTNTAPVLSVTGTGAATAGSSYTLNLGATDPGDDTLTAWRVDWGDGTIELLGGGVTSATHTYNVAGLTHNVLVSATDEDGVWYTGAVFFGGENSSPVFRYDAHAGNQQGATGTSPSLADVRGLIVGPDGLLYAAGFDSNNVQRFNATTGAFVDEFIAPGTGGLSSPTSLAFGPDGNLYVSNQSGNNVLRFDGSSGAFIDVFVSSGSGGLDKPQHLMFGKDGNLYVANRDNNSILRFNGSTGSFIDEFVSQNSGGLGSPHSFDFGRDGNLYVASTFTAEILRYNGSTGAFIDTFVSAGSGGLNQPTSIRFGPDDLLYVTGRDGDNVLRFNLVGNYVDQFVPASDGILNPRGIAFAPIHQVAVSSGVNTVPSATNMNQTFSYTEGDSTVAIADIVVTDPDIGETITATLTLNLPAAGSLTTGTFRSSTSTYNSGTGVWQITGTVNDVNAALAAVVFSPEVNNDQDAQVAVHIEDSSAGSPTDGLIQLNVTPQNDAPFIDLDANDSSGASGADYQTTYVEGAGPVFVADFLDATLVDVDSSQLTALTVTISNLFNGADESLLANTSGTSIASSYSGGVLSLTGTDSVANYQQVLRTIRYQNVATAPNTTTRLIQFVANDGAASSNVATTQLSVVATNNTPIITAPTTYGASEDADATLSGISVVDPDIGLNNLTVVLEVNHGILRLDSSVIGGLTTGEITGNGTRRVTVAAPITRLNTTLASPNGLVYRGDNHHWGTDTLSIQASDQATTGAHSSTINVAPVNDAPAPVGDRFTINSGDALLVAGPGLLQNDFDVDGDALTAILVSGPSSGVLALGNDGSFKFTPRDSFTGSISFQYAVTDGTVTSSPVTVVIDVATPILPPSATPTADDSVDATTEDSNQEEDNSDPEAENNIEAIVSNSVTPEPQVRLIGQSTSQFDDNDLKKEIVQNTRLSDRMDASEETTDGDSTLGIDQNQYSDKPRVQATRHSVGLLGAASFDSKLLWSEMDEIANSITQSDTAAVVFAGSFAGFSGALSVGYVMWTVRGGLLATSLLAHLPAWSFVDPLLVLDDLDASDEHEDDSLEGMIEKSDEQSNSEGLSQN